MVQHLSPVDSFFKLYVVENSPVNLGFSFDLTSPNLTVYVDGSYYTDVATPSVRAYYSLGANYNPFRWIRTIKPSTNPEKPQTTIHSAFFNGAILDQNHELIKSMLFVSNFLPLAVK